MDPAPERAEPPSGSLVQASFVVDGAPPGSAALRQQVRRYLGERGVSEGRVADAVLVLSELLANALEASPAYGVVDVAVTTGAGSIRLDVTNRLSSALPHVWPALASIEMPPPTDVRGRGLPLVAALVARMSIHVGDDHTHVCAELAP